LDTDSSCARSPAQALHQHAALAVGVTRVAGRHQRFTRLLDQLARVAQRRFGQLGRRARRLQCTLVCVSACHGCQRAFGTCRGHRVVAGPGHALAAGQLFLAVLQAALAALQVGDHVLVGVEGGDAHDGMSRKSFDQPAMSSRLLNTCWAICSTLAAAW
jgi:hypothetical protein